MGHEPDALEALMSERAVHVRSYPPGKTASAPDMPTLLIHHRASLDCGCGVFVGRRLDNGEAATGAEYCAETHRPLIERFNESMRASLMAVTDRQLIDIVAQMLLAAAAGEPDGARP